MRLLRTELDNRLTTQLDKSIKIDNTRGIIKFGSNNDYPQIIERLILGSISGKSIANIYAKFLCGQGFVNQSLNDIIIGKDEKYKDITLLSLLRQVCDSIAFYNGCYIHINFTREAKAVSAKLLPFKHMRFGAIDDNGYTSKVYSHINWERDPLNKTANDRNFNISDVKKYDLFNLQTSAFKELVGEDIKQYPGQVYCHFLDNTYIYPLSPFDSVYLDLDTENQVALFKNRQIRNGLLNKTVLRVVSPNNEEEREELHEGISNFLGADGDNVLILEDEIDMNTGNIKKDGAFAIDQINTNITPDLFNSWEPSLINNVRKACKGVPAVLIDYDESKLGTTSGEGILQAVNYYNSMTLDDRAGISKMFKDIFKNSINQTLANNIDWDIKPLML
jgi:hypothetical protein